ncbi:hypothetical protein [Phocaeicola sp.]
MHRGGERKGPVGAGESGGWKRGLPVGSGLFSKGRRNGQCTFCFPSENGL